MSQLIRNWYLFCFLRIPGEDLPSRRHKTLMFMSMWALLVFLCFALFFSDHVFDQFALDRKYFPERPINFRDPSSFGAIYFGILFPIFMLLFSLGTRHIEHHGMEATPARKGKLLLSLIFFALILSPVLAKDFVPSWVVCGAHMAGFLFLWVRRRDGPSVR